MIKEIVKNSFKKEIDKKIKKNNKDLFIIFLY